jgi:hypothetical protein
VWPFYGAAPAPGAGSISTRHRPTGGAAGSSVEVDVIPFRTVGSVE